MTVYGSECAVKRYDSERKKDGLLRLEESERLPKEQPSNEAVSGCTTARFQAPRVYTLITAVQEAASADHSNESVQQ